MRLSFLGLEKGESPVYCLRLNELWVSGCLQQSWALLILYIKHANKYIYGCITQAKGVQRAGPDHKGPLHGQGWVTDAQSCFVSAGHTGLCVCFVRSVCPHFFYYMQILMWESEFWLFFFCVWSALKWAPKCLWHPGLPDGLWVWMRVFHLQPLILCAWDHRSEGDTNMGTH